MKIYMVYVDMEDERAHPAEVELFIDKEKAIARANELKNKYQYSSDWELADEFDAEDLTDANNSILFIHKKYCCELTVDIDEVETED